MVLVLHLVSYIAGLAGFCFALLSLANGLLYVAEVIEEHSAFAKTVGQRIIYAEIVLFGLLLQNFSRHWPVISVKSLTFVLSCLIVLLSHYLSFRHFSSRSLAAASHHSYPRYDPRKGRYASQGAQTESFLEVATYFGVCVWLVPFYLFLSLSANDNVLPSSGEGSTSSSRRASAAPSSPSLSVPSHPSRTPDSPTLGRHARHRSSMMKSALSSCFSIIPSSLRPSTLSHSLPLNTGGAGPRMDVPRSPSPTFGFQPYANGGGGGSVEAREAYASSPSGTAAATKGRPHLSLVGRQGSNDRLLPGAGVSMSPTSSYHPAFPPSPSSPHLSHPLSTSLPPSLSLHAPSPSPRPGSGSALPPSLSPSNPRFPIPSPSPQSPSVPPSAGGRAGSQPPSPAQARFTRPLPAQGGPPPGMVRRHTAQLVQQHSASPPPPPPPSQQGQGAGLGRRSSEAQGLRGRFVGAGGAGGEQGGGG
ncbi:Protein SVP26 [Rhodotorula toruloides]|nr:Protein SVP26 [Rhodotorula toruloides]